MHLVDGMHKSWPLTKYLYCPKNNYVVQDLVLYDDLLPVNHSLGTKFVIQKKIKIKKENFSPFVYFVS